MKNERLRIKNCLLNGFLFWLFLVNPVFSMEEVASPIEEPLIEVLKIKDVDKINKASIVTILALNKITAKSFLHDVEVGKSFKFERLSVQPLFCWKSSPEDVPENKVLLKITETKLDGNNEQIFYGWIFSSSPGLSPLEHSMYDITVVDCKNDNAELKN
jgi:hypothetical protein